MQTFIEWLNEQDLEEGNLSKLALMMAALGPHAAQADEPIIEPPAQPPPWVAQFMDPNHLIEPSRLPRTPPPLAPGVVRGSKYRSSQQRQADVEYNRSRQYNQFLRKYTNWYNTNVGVKH